MAKINVKYTKSAIGCNHRQKRVLVALGLTKLNQVRVHDDSPQVLGMVEKIKHLVTIVK